MGDVAEEMECLDGMFAGLFKPEEYEHLIVAGLLRFSYEGVGGFLGLATLRRTRTEPPHA